MCSSFVLWVIRQLVSSFPAFISFMISSQQEASTPPVLKTRFFPYMSGKGSSAVLHIKPLHRPPHWAWQSSMPSGRYPCLLPLPIRHPRRVQGSASLSPVPHPALTVDNDICQSLFLSQLQPFIRRINGYDHAGAVKPCAHQVHSPVGPAPITATVSAGLISAREAPQ